MKAWRLNMEVAEDRSLTILEDQSLDVLGQANALQVANREDYDVASALNKAAIDLKKKIKSFFAPMVQKAHEAHKAVKDTENLHLKPVEEAISMFKRKMTDWYMEEQRKVREQEEKVRQEAIRQAEEARLKEAEELEEKGEAEKAEEVLGAPIAEPVFKPKEVERPQGVSYRDNWKFELVDESALPRPYLMPDMQKIAGVVRSMKGKTKIDGVRVFNEPIQINRG